MDVGPTSAIGQYSRQYVVSYYWRPKNVGWTYTKHGLHNVGLMTLCGGRPKVDE
jgi:hypothetical protein